MPPGFRDAAINNGFELNNTRSETGRETVKLWDVGTRQELSTFSGISLPYVSRWTSDGDTILWMPENQNRTFVIGLSEFLSPVDPCLVP